MAKLKPQHLYELTFVSNPALSPDGTQVAAVQTTVHPAKDKGAARYQSHIHLYDLSANKTRQISQYGETNTLPRFSPDGTRFAFLSKRQEDTKPQLYVFALNGGDGKRMTVFTDGVSDFAWHPNGSSIVLVSRGDWQDKASEHGETKVIDNLFYKLNGLGLKAQTVSQLHQLSLKTGQTQQLTQLKANPRGMAFSPDGKQLYFFAHTNSEAEDEWIVQLHALELTSKKVTLLGEPVAGATTPSPSPDGNYIAYTAATKGYDVASVKGLWLLPLAKGKPVLLTGEVDAEPSTGGDSNHGSYPNVPCWLSDKEILINANLEGRSSLATINIKSKLLELWDKSDRVVTSFHHANGISVYTAESPDKPGELFVHQDGKETRLSKLNDRFVKKYQLQQQRAHRFTHDGVELDYWTLTPANPRKDKAMVLQVHGGPHTNYGYGFYHEFHMLAAAGYTVIYGNPRGSSSYGQAFSLALQGQYGTVDANDILAIAAHARKTFRRKRAPMHLTGGSYGGFMTNWLVGHTDEFKSAVTQRSICNWLSFYGTSDIGYRFAETEVGGNPWQDTGKLWEQSPIKYVDYIKTPLLIMHAEEDHRCPIEQAEQLYVALKRLGNAPTRLVRFPGEDHELSRSGRPDRRVQRLELMLEWFASPS